MKIKNSGWFSLAGGVGLSLQAMNSKVPASSLIRAGGGLVENERGEVLFMFRRNTWDLPKGKLDEGESPEACALREVKEETGIVHLELKEFLLVTKHTYEEKGRIILKETHWYRMHGPRDQALIPQLEEDITQLKWIGEAGFGEVKQNTFPTILDVLRAAGFKIS
ncbi:MAG: NUDIX domain-containing protein [Puia sp.]